MNRLLSAFLFLSTVTFAQTKLKVISANEDGLPFVNIVLDTIHKKGVTMTDIHGEATIPFGIPHIQISFLGFETKNLLITKPNMVVVLTKEVSSLEQVVLTSKENPAWSILRKVRKQIDSLNPYKRLAAFQYTEYSKFVVKADLEDSQNARYLKKIKPVKLLLGEGKTNLLQSETIQQNYFKQNDNHKIKILASKFTGFKKKTIPIIRTQIFPFHFFDDYISLLRRQYINPITDNYYQHYNYHLIDTVIIDSIKTYHLKFTPKNRYNIQSLIGDIYIGFEEFNVKKMNVTPSNPGGTELYIEITNRKQKSKYWLPHEMKYKFFFMEIDGVKLYNNGHSLLSDYNLNPTDTVEFGANNVLVEKGAALKNEAYWEKNRKVKLSEIEQQTYQKYDSLPSLDFFGEMFEKLNVKQQIQMPYVDIDLRQLLVNNDLEGQRWGVGLYTNQYLTDRVYFGGYVGKGANDDVLKWGMSAVLNINKELKSKFILGYSYDYLENNAENIFQYLAYENNLKKEASLKYRWIQGYYDWELILKNQNIQFYDLPNQNYLPSNNFVEAGVKLNFDYYKQYRPSLVDEYSVFKFLRTNAIRWLPRIDFSANFGTSKDNPQSKYLKTILAFENLFAFKTIGLLDIRLEAGCIFGTYHPEKMFTGQSLAGGGTSFFLNHKFQTVGVSEFVQNRYIALFTKYNLINIGLPSMYSRPQVFLINNFSFGDNSTHITGTKDTSKGLFETGLFVEHLFQYPIFGIGFIGGGVGAFKRYGPLASSDDMRMKLNMTFTY